MIDQDKLQYFTMAAWLRGYATALDRELDKLLIHRLNKAADMLDPTYVWGKYQEEEEQGDA